MLLNKLRIFRSLLKKYIFRLIFDPDESLKKEAQRVKFIVNVHYTLFKKGIERGGTLSASSVSRRHKEAVFISRFHNMSFRMMEL